MAAQSDEVTSVVRSPFNARQLYSSSRDGTVILWDLEKATRLKRFVVGRPLDGVAPSAVSPGLLYLAVRTAQKGKEGELYLKSELVAFDSAEGTSRLIGGSSRACLLCSPIRNFTQLHSTLLYYTLLYSTLLYSTLLY